MSSRVDNNKEANKGNMIDSPDLVGSMSNGSNDHLPLDVVDHSDNVITNKLYTRFSWTTRVLILIPIIMISIAVGGITGLYKQPQPLQHVMEFFDLVPGNGADYPIALPINSKEKGIEVSSPSSRKESPVVASSTSIGNVLEISTVMALGRLLPISNVITVGVPSGVRDARISTLKVAEGSQVKKGDILAVLDNKPRLQAIRDSAIISISVREASLIQIRSSIRASFIEAKAAVEKAKASANRARLDFQRSKTLFNKKVVARANFDQTRSVYVEAQKEVERKLATLSRYSSKKPDVQPDIIVARRSLQASRAEYKRTEQEFEQAYVRAPIDGTVLEIHTRAGEKVSTNGVLDLGNIEQMTAKLEVYETLVRHIARGQRVVISSKALSEKLFGKISRIGMQIKKQSVIGSDPAANTDARVVEVIVLLDQASSKVASRFTNLQVEAKIKIEKKL